jgi:hypothetical protein
MAFDFRMSSDYYKDSLHHVKLALSGKQDKDPSGDETDTKLQIKDMEQFSKVFITSLKVVSSDQNLASISDSIFEVEPTSEKTLYRLETYYKAQIYKEGALPYKVLDLLEADLENLDENNFVEKIDLGFDIRNASQLRYFLSSVYFIRARAEGLILLSFDTEDSMVCQNWTVEVHYDLNLREDISIHQQADYSEIPCRDDWKEQIYPDLEPTEENPVREKVAYPHLGSILH